MPVLREPSQHSGVQGFSKVSDLWVFHDWSGWWFFPYWKSIEELVPVATGPGQVSGRSDVSITVSSGRSIGLYYLPSGSIHGLPRVARKFPPWSFPSVESHWLYPGFADEAWPSQDFQHNLSGSLPELQEFPHPSSGQKQEEGILWISTQSVECLKVETNSLGTTAKMKWKLYNYSRTRGKRSLMSLPAS